MRWKQVADARRILDGETGTIVKDWGGKVAIALVYPNTYYVGMSSLGLQTLYRLFNARSDAVCERVFHAPQVRSSNRYSEPLSIETQKPLTDFSLLAFTLSYEMDYFNVVQLLRSAGIPVLARERDDRWPLLVAGGPAVSSNPEPMAPIFDAIFIGEGEEAINPLLDACIAAEVDRERTLVAWSGLAGMYVPCAHTDDSLPQTRVERQWVRELDRFPTHSAVLTPDTEFGDLYLIEIARGCGRGCRFCLAGYYYRPPRERSVDLVLDQASEGLKHRSRIGLVSAAISDYGHVDELVGGLRGLGARIAVSSLRADSLSETLVAALADSGTRTLTIAPEAGGQRLRRVINKAQSEADLLRAADWATKYGFAQLKLYFMVGHPSEIDEDMNAIVDLVRKARLRFGRRLTINLTPFVPKPHTPFQWAAMTERRTIQDRQVYVKNRLRGSRVEVKSDSAAWAAVQGVLARGDRRLAGVMRSMDHVTLPAWRRAMTEHQLAPEEFLRERSPDEPLPWHVVDGRVAEAFLQREWLRSQREQVGHSCPPGALGCTACGVCADNSVTQPGDGVTSRGDGHDNCEAPASEDSGAG